MRCNQCNWHGTTQASIREIKTIRSKKKRVVDPDTAEVSFVDVEGSSTVWSPLNRQEKEGDTVRYKCPVCKAGLREE